MLKAEFPLNVDNETAVYDLGIGSVERKNNTETAYEVPAQYWADLTDKDRSYGVSILNNCKYGWDKPDNNTLRLTLLHTPGTQRGFIYQDKQDMGFHTFTYSIVGHKGGYVEAETVAKAEALNRPLTAFTVPKHAGAMGKNFSFLQTSSSQMMAKALKKAEKADYYVVRLYETTGKEARNFELSFASDILEANELNGVEDVTGKANFSGKKLTFNAGPFSIKTFGIKLKPENVRLTPPQSVPVDLNYNIKASTVNAFRSDASIDGKGYSYSAELLPASLTSGGVDFKFGNPVLENAVRCNGDTVLLPQTGQYNKLYLLAASVSGDDIATFYVDDKPTELIIPYYSGFIGQWDHTGFTKGFFKPAEVAYIGTHRHNSVTNADAPYEFTYLFKYCINIPQNAKKIILSNDSKVLLFAASVATNENDDITPAVDLISTALKPEILKSAYATARKNLLKGKPVIGKSTPDETNANNNRNSRRGGRPEAAIDGNYNSQWVDVIEDGKPPYIEVDMQKENTIRGWFVFQGAQFGTGITAAKEYKLEVKKNPNDPWQTVDIVQDNTESETNRLLSSPVAARYVRLTILKGVQEGRSTSRITEFEVY